MYRHILFIFLLFNSSSYLYPQKVSETKNKEIETLAAKLIETKTDEERELLLKREPHLLTPELAKTLVSKIIALTDKVGYSELVDIGKFSLSLAERIGDKTGIGMNYILTGQISLILGDHKKALEETQRALSIGEEIKDKNLIALSFNNIGAIYHRQGNYPLALDYYQQCLKIREELGAEVEVAKLLNNIGVIYFRQSNYAQSLDYLTRGLKLREKIGNKRAIASSLLAIGNLHTMQGEYTYALEYYQKGLRINEELDDKRGIGYVLSNMGALYNIQSNHSMALEYSQKALEILQKVGDKHSTASIMTDIGLIYRDIGNRTQALDYFRKGLNIQKELNNKHGIAQLLVNIGSIYQSQREYVKSLDYYQQGLTLIEEIGDKVGIAETLNHIGYVYKERKDFTQALQYYQKSLRISETATSQRVIANSYIGIGLTYLNQMRYELSQVVSGNKKSEGEAPSQMAQNYLKKGLDISRKAGLRSYEAAALRGLSVLESSNGNWSNALFNIEAAVKIIESIRANVGVDKRISYFSSVQDYYHLYVNVLMQLHKLQPGNGYIETAFQVAERSRSRVLIELLTQARINVDQEVQPELRDRKRKLQRQIDLKSEQQINLLSGKHTKEELLALENELGKLIQEHEEIEVKIRQSNPKYASLMQPLPIKVKDIQEKVLDKDSLLLEFLLTEDKSHLWAITSDSITSYELPKRSVIEQMARLLRDTLTVRSQLYSPEKQIQAIKKADKEYERISLKLSRILLGPVVSKLKNKRLIIVPDGALNFIPFPALPDPTTDRNIANKRSLKPLIVDHEMINLPSATTLLVLRQEAKDAARQVAHLNERPDQSKIVKRKRITLLADPVFNKGDLRVTSNADNRKNLNNKEVGQASEPVVKKPLPEVLASLAESREQVNSMAVTEEMILPRLEYTRELANHISAITPKGEADVALDFEANRAKVLSGDVSNSQIVVFATHGLLNSRYPELSGIVMSLVDKDGKTQNGFLQLKDIYNMRLNSNLVILAACETAMGEEIKGEGVIGLTRGFMYAGAKGVIASLWKVDEEATVELIKRIYQYMEKDGMISSAALRKAQISLYNEKRWSTPFYWSGFTLLGEWK